MPKQPGFIYKLTDDDRYAIAYHAEQFKKFKQQEKVLVHIYLDKECTIKAGEAGTDLKVLKSLHKLKLIGFTD